MKEDIDFMINRFGSGYGKDGMYYEKVQKDPKSFNLQLRYWIEAVIQFRRLNGHFAWEEAILILHLLCSSLETLAGVNIKSIKRDRTPFLRELYEKTLKDDYGWDLSLDKEDQYNVLLEMDNYHKNLSKHLNSTKSRRDLLNKFLNNVDYQRLCDYMKTTQEIWLWMLEKRFEGKNNIEEDQLQFLREEF
ncbi:MAG: hypothetical protein JRI96_14895 [Deltaproteobacteria bacterium]|nr:hypothetical protein [Deltaproteobacteria bacterium]